MTRTLPFNLEEFARRSTAVQAEMAKRDTDLLLLDQPETIAYLLGYAVAEGLHQFCVVPRDGQPTMVLRTVDSGTCRRFSWIDDIIGYADWDDPIELLEDLTRKRRWAKSQIGVDQNCYNLTVQRFHTLQEAFDGSQFQDYSEYFIRCRALKSPTEIAHLRRASRIADRTFQALLTDLEIGDSVRDCTALAAQHTIRLGGDPAPVGPVTKNIADNNMHALVDDEPIHEGDVLHVELCPYYKGYGSRIMRPIHMGPAPQDLLCTAKEIVALQDRQFAAMRPGVAACDIDAILRDGMLNSGLKPSYSNISGYSLGYYQLYTPRASDFTYIFRPSDTWLLETGMVFHMYTVASGLAFSETICITANGSERLTATDRNLLINLNGDFAASIA